MATLLEIYGLVNDPSLTQKTEAACLVAAGVIMGENAGTSNHANRLKWAKSVAGDPVTQGQRMLRLLLATYSGQLLPAITGATDAAIQSAVNAAVDTLADGT